MFVFTTSIDHPRYFRLEHCSTIDSYPDGHPLPLCHIGLGEFCRCAVPAPHLCFQETMYFTPNISQNDHTLSLQPISRISKGFDLNLSFLCPMFFHVQTTPRSPKSGTCRFQPIAALQEHPAAEGLWDHVEVGTAPQQGLNQSGETVLSSSTWKWERNKLWILGENGEKSRFNSTKKLGASPAKLGISFQSWII